MTKRVKARAILTMWVMCSISAAFFIPNDIARVVVLLCAPIGTYFVLRVPTKAEAEAEK